MAVQKPKLTGGLGDIGKLTELKQRLLFVLGAFVVFRIGTFIPVPGVDPVVLAELFEQQTASEKRRLLDFPAAHWSG